MGLTTRSSNPHCLFCSKKCSQGTSLISGCFIGAVSNSQLQLQLQHFFIARNLLDIPSEWLEDILQKNEGHCNPSSWFNLCNNCLTTVEQARQVHQNILQLESKLKGIKEGIREEMKRAIKKIKKPPEGIDADIRKLLFPDLIKVKKEIKVDIMTAAVDDDFFPDFFSDPLLQEDVPKCSKPRPQRRKKPVKKTNNANYPSKTCLKCQSRFTTDEEYEAHEKAHLEVLAIGGEHVCQLCGFPSFTADELQGHMNIRHMDTRSQRKKDISCPQCDYKTPVWKHLKAHVQAEHPDIPEEQIAELNLDLKCPICSKVFAAGMPHLIIHQKKMHPELFGAEMKCVQCDHCSRMFPDEIRLKYHIRNEHFRMNRFMCDDCGKGFAHQKDLNRHKISHQIQQGKREFICDICGCDYAYESALVNHRKTFHPDGAEIPTEEFTCKYCDLKTPFRAVLIRHMRTHKAEMGFQCDICSKNYASAQGLRRHKAINHGNTKASCPHCFKIFTHQEYVNNHLRLFCKMKSLNEKTKDADMKEVSEGEEQKQGTSQSVKVDQPMILPDIPFSNFS